MTSEKETISYPFPPGNMGLPFVGEGFNLLSDPQDFPQKRHQKYGSIFKTRIFGQPMIYVYGVEACHFILSNENKYFQNKMLPSIEKLLGSSSLTIQTGQRHQNRRKILRKAFSQNYLNEQIGTIKEITETYLARWIKLEQFTWYPELQNYTFDVACKLFIGLDRASDTDLGYLYNIWNQGLFSFSPPFPWTKFGRALKSRQQILLYIEKIVRDRQQENKLGTDVLSLLLQARDEEGNSLSLEEIKDQILNLLSAGHGTLASALTSFCLLLAQHPNILERCRQEQRVSQVSKSITWEYLEQMKYLELVIKETLRIMPPVGGGFREVIQDCSFNNYLFPKGWRVVYQIPLTHKDPTLFTSPEIFNPERFNINKEIDSKRYFPFGGGKRRCLGENLARLEMKIFADSLLRNYDWNLISEQNLEINQIPFPHPTDGLKVQFDRISKKDY